MFSLAIDDLIESGTNYIKFGNGTLIQWGRFNSNTNQQYSHTVTLPLSYKDISYLAFATLGDVGYGYPTVRAGIGVQMWASQTTKTSFVIDVKGNAASYSIPINWLTIGKWK